ncbi:MAG: AraC family transcriptional regulator, partial [Pseudomonadota bacterium]|nr:AraC family transcriptional regulator [Pseudomonadota bacterium]
MLNTYSPIFMNTPANLGKSLSTRAGVGTAICISQQVTTHCRRLSVNDPAVAVVFRGRKIIRLTEGEIIVNEGSAVVMPAGFEADIVNEVAEDGHYRALCFCFAQELLPLRNLDERGSLTRTTLLPDVQPGFIAAIDAAIDATGDTTLPHSIVAHRANELQLWLASHDIILASPSKDDLVGAIKRHIAADLAKDWPAVEISSAMGMSEATLRRKLAKVGHSLSEILSDSRMSAAPVMLQSTGDSITQIAFAVGYESPSRFATRFRKRFGFVPSVLRK